MHEDELWELNQKAADAIFNSPTFAAGVAAFEQRRRPATSAAAGS